ncbi:hypothetical protein TRVL_03845 [Trypanosoma vivax]|nr:hypothetical protein TRVL_03845 [Trypanosoma vivax]
MCGGGNAGTKRVKADIVRTRRDVDARQGEYQVWECRKEVGNLRHGPCHREGLRKATAAKKWEENWRGTWCSGNCCLEGAEKEEGGKARLQLRRQKKEKTEEGGLENVTARSRKEVMGLAYRFYYRKDAELPECQTKRDAARRHKT